VPRSHHVTGESSRSCRSFWSIQLGVACSTPSIVGNGAGTWLRVRSSGSSWPSTPCHTACASGTDASSAPTSTRPCQRTAHCADVWSDALVAAGVLIRIGSR
jgi:hypothetical protein